MVPEEAARTPESFTTFGDLLRYLRERAALRQRDVAAVAHMRPSDLSRLEQNLEPPDATIVQHRLVPALGLEYQPEWAARLLALANEPALPGAKRATPTHGDQPAFRGRSESAQPLAEGWPEPPLLVTKFYIPRSYGRRVARARLLDRLDQALGVPLTLVAAPPGSGKTTLLADWAASRSFEFKVLSSEFLLREQTQNSKLKTQNCKVAWLSLDGDDNDPSTFLRYLVGALRVAVPGVGSATLALLQPSLPEAKTLLTPLVNQVAELADETVLVLDDWHMVTNRSVSQLLDWLLEHLPPHLHLVIASRTDPALPLPQLRARGRLVELRGADLRFQGAEAHDLLRLASGSELSLGETLALEQRTEGWAAGLHLAGLALRGRHDRAEFIAAFAGSHRYVADYLTSEVLDRLPAYLRSFVLQTAILERMCAALCSVVVEVDAQAFIADSRAAAQHDSQSSELDAQRLLEELERMQLFMVPLDDQRRWYRYHHLFAEVVREQLRHTFGAAAVARLHQRASEWFDRADLVDDALSHALAAGATEQAAGIVERRAAGMIESGVLLPLWRWLARLPGSVVHAHPPLALAGAMVAIAVGDLARAAALLDRAGSPIDTVDTVGLGAAQPAGWLNCTAATAQLTRASLARAHGDAEHARALVQQAIAIAPPSQPFLHAWASWELGSAELLAGDLQAAQEAFEAPLDATLWRFGGLALQVMVGQARIATLRGRLHTAAQLYERALDAARREPAGASRAIGVLHVGLATLYREQNELGAAEHQLERALAVGGDPPSALLTALTHVALARIKQAQGDMAAAGAALGQAQLMLPALRAPFFLDLLLSYGYAHACLAQGDITAISALLDIPTLTAETRRLVRARLLVKQGQPGAALELIGSLLTEAEAGGRAGSAIELLILQGLAQRGAGDRSGAFAALERALRLAEPEGYVRIFADEGVPMADLLREAQARGIMPDYVAKLLAALPRTEGQGLRTESTESLHSVLSPQSSSLVEPLTSRELEVLQLIAAGYSNRAIARALVIELGTVKRHVHSLLGKLDAQNRTQAIAHARANGLLADRL